MLRQILKIMLAILVTISCAGTALAAGQFGYYPGTNHPFCPPLKDYKYTPKAYGTWDNSVNYRNFSGPHFGCRTQKAGGPNSTPPSITNFNNGATISKNQVVKFSKNGTVVNWWYLAAGSTANSNNYYVSGALPGSATQHTIKGLPSGKTIHITFFHYGKEKKWIRRNYTVKTSPGTTTTLKKSGPIVASYNGQVIENLDITSTSHSKCGITVRGKRDVKIRNVNINHAGAGICVFDSPNTRIDKARVANTISKAGPHCKDGVSVSKCKLTSNRTHGRATAEYYPVWDHVNIRVENSPGVRIDTVRLERGEAGIYTEKASGIKISNLHCLDMRGPYWLGQCVFLRLSNNATVDRFYSQQFLIRHQGMIL